MPCKLVLSGVVLWWQMFTIWLFQPHPCCSWISYSQAWSHSSNPGVCMACHSLRSSYPFISSLPKCGEVGRQVEQDLAVVVSERDTACRCRDSEGSTSMRPRHRGRCPLLEGAETHLVMLQKPPELKWTWAWDSHQSATYVNSRARKSGCMFSIFHATRAVVSTFTAYTSTVSHWYRNIYPQHSEVALLA